MIVRKVLVLVLAAAVCPAALRAQPAVPSRVDLAFDRVYDYPEMVDILHKLVVAYPELLALESLGKSTEGRDIWLVTINNPKTGSDRDKAAMYIDGNVHGNEVQATEVCLYTIWYLTKSYGVVDKLTTLVDERAFYIVPSVNPDGRAWWFDQPNTSSTSRSGKKPTDNDNDGLYDEDGYDDLDGDGFITMMYQKDPNGRFLRSRKDPRMFERVGRDEKGDYSMIGMEGIDNDNDGRMNEDGPGGYDLNRNWPSGWKPNYIQFGAGDYPFSHPESRCIGEFLLDHPNVAAAQSYHNTGGMILRGPGAENRESYYPPADVAVYDEIGQIGEKMLPFYRYMVLYKDLYTVHGGFVNWVSEGLGIFSFTNELWANAKYYYGKEGDWDRNEQRFKFNDLLQFDQLWVPLKPYDHPTYGEVLIGGWNKYASRVQPMFMLEELCHRNFAFTMFHADHMPKLAFTHTRVRKLAPGTWEITVEIQNEKAIPTISALAAEKNIGARDQVKLLSIAGAPDAGLRLPDTRVLASGRPGSWRSVQMVDLTERSPERIWVDNGIGRYGTELFRWIVEGAGEVEVVYTSQKGGKLKKRLTLEESEWIKPPAANAE